ncbi:alpha/beta hydrolase [Nibrella saemangeumensis]|uniref:Alpha/beta hydrolase n=1 Tax=Nibrella saemangeumensis TaxID=1084526 RepID=A0ABP8NIJ6_9BACT
MKRFFLVVVVLLVIIIAALYRPDIPVEVLRERYKTPVSHVVEVDGMPVHYRAEGASLDTVPLILLHGSGASLLTWDGWIPYFRNDTRIIRLDLPGYGLTGPHPNNEGSPAYYAKFLAFFLDRLKIRRCDIAGNSLGGATAWQFALRYPERVRKLVLIDAAGYPNRPEAVPVAFRLARLPVLSSLFAHMTPKALFRASLESVYANNQKVTDALVQQYYDMSLRAGNRRAFVRRAYQPDSTWQQIRTIRHPTLIMWGQQDRLIPILTAYRFHDDLPNDTLLVYPNAGHVPMEELPQQTALDARQFLKK